MKNINEEVKEIPKGHTFALVCVALVTLFNPNVNLVDILPDFIGYYLLSRVFLRPSFSTPYFDEARRGFLRLFALSLLKIPAFFVMIFIRSGNTQDNDIVALLALVFCVFELILLIPTVSNTFNALIYLAGRRGLDSILGEEGQNATTPVRTLTLIYFVVKCLFYSLPELLRLTRMVDIGNQTVVATGSMIYPFVIVGAQVLGYIFGAIWLAKTLKYVKAIKNEGKFFSAVSEQENDSDKNKYQRSLDLAKRKRGHLYLILAAIATFEITFDNYHGINLIPHFICGMLMLAGIHTLSGFIDENRRAVKRLGVIASISFIVTAAVSYAVGCSFLTRYGMSSLFSASSKGARELYSVYEATALIELLTFLFTLVCFTLLMRHYIRGSFGVSPLDERYGRLEAEYHGGLFKRTVILSSLYALIAVAKYLNVIFSGNPQALESGGGAENSSIIIASAVPWFNTVTIGLAIIISLYSIYFFGALNQEIKDGYTK